MLGVATGSDPAAAALALPSANSPAQLSLQHWVLGPRAASHRDAACVFRGFRCIGTVSGGLLVAVLSCHMRSDLPKGSVCTHSSFPILWAPDGLVSVPNRPAPAHCPSGFYPECSEQPSCLRWCPMFPPIRGLSQLLLCLLRPPFLLGLCEMLSFYRGGWLYSPPQHVGDCPTERELDPHMICTGHHHRSGAN